MGQSLMGLFPFEDLRSISVWSMADFGLFVTAFLIYETRKGYVTWQELLVTVNMSNTHPREASEVNACPNDIVNISGLVFFLT